LPILSKSKTKFNLAFCPERTLEGQALKELRELPQIVGGVDLESSVKAAQLFQFLTPMVVRVSSLETAELIKLIDNVARDVLFAFANEVAKISDAVGVSAIEVIKAGRLGYSRTNLPIPGPVGGPCLEKDSYILIESLEEKNLVPKITLDARKLNESQPEEIANYLAEITKEILPDNPIISLLGIAFKGRPVTDDLRGTTAKPIFESLKRHFPKAEFKGYDSVVKQDQIKEFGIEPVQDIEEAFRGSNIVLILNNHPIFSSMDVENLAKEMAKPGIIYDFWNNFTDRNLCLPKDIKYTALGSHNLYA